MQKIRSKSFTIAGITSFEKTFKPPHVYLMGGQGICFREIFSDRYLKIYFKLNNSMDLPAFRYGGFQNVT